MNAPHILVTTDRSEESKRAFAPVASLARALKARVTVLFVVHNQTVLVAPASAAMPTLHMNPEEAAKSALTELEPLRAQFAGVAEVSVDVVVGGDVAAAIVKRANELSVDYIAMATHGHSGIKRLLLGSVAEIVVRHATTPVILYPPHD
jgi:nucleotide-binding universal stress UspA family protein